MNQDFSQIDQVLTRGAAEILPNQEGLAKLMAERKIRLYLGIDPTGGLLHLGHAVGLRKLQQFAELGHEVILLVGNGTVKIGDPTGRDKSRPMLTEEQIEENFKDWQQQASKILDFDDITIKRNADWLEELNYSDLIKLLAKTTVQQLMERDMFQRRMENEQPIFGHEIIYPLIQGYDSVAMDVDLEIGGTDQTFNMMMGRTLQKIYNDKEKWVLTTPLIEGTDGRKMSKTYNNYVALTAEPKDMYGKLMSIQDDLIIRYFQVLTDEPLVNIKEMQQAMENGANPLPFKKKLALTITADLHDKQAAKKAKEHFERTIQQGELPQNMPEIEAGESPIQLLELLNLCLPQESNSQFRRWIEQGAVRLMPEDKKLTDPYQNIKLENNQVIRVGKRRYFKIIIK